MKSTRLIPILIAFLASVFPMQTQGGDNDARTLELNGIRFRVAQIQITQNAKPAFSEFSAAKGCRLLVVTLEPAELTTVPTPPPDFDVSMWRLFSESGTPIRARMIVKPPGDTLKRPTAEPTVEISLSQGRLESGILTKVSVVAPIDTNARRVVVKSGDMEVFAVDCAGL